MEATKPTCKEREEFGGRLFWLWNLLHCVVLKSLSFLASGHAMKLLFIPFQCIDPVYKEGDENFSL